MMQHPIKVSVYRKIDTHVYYRGDDNYFSMSYKTSTVRYTLTELENPWQSVSSKQRRETSHNFVIAMKDDSLVRFLYQS